MDKEWIASRVIENCATDGPYITLIDVGRIAEVVLAAHEQDKAEAMAAQSATWKDIEQGYLSEIKALREEWDMAEGEIAILKAQVAVMANLLQRAHDNMDWAGPEGDSTTALLLEAIEMALESVPQVLFHGRATVEHDQIELFGEATYFYDEAGFYGELKGHIASEGDEIDVILARPEQNWEETKSADEE